MCTRPRKQGPRNVEHRSSDTDVHFPPRHITRKSLPPTATHVIRGMSIPNMCPTGTGTGTIRAPARAPAKTETPALAVGTGMAPVLFVATVARCEKPARLLVALRGRGGWVAPLVERMRRAAVPVCVCVCVYVRVRVRVRGVRSPGWARCTFPLPRWDAVPVVVRVLADALVRILLRCG